MERVLPADLQVLAELFGPHSRAAAVLRVVQEADNVLVYRDGSRLIITDPVGDTTAFGPGPYIEHCRVHAGTRSDLHPHSRSRASDQV